MAINPAARQKLIDQLKVHSMQREYVAYVEGRPPQPKGTWRNWLKLREDELRQFVISAAEAKLAGRTTPPRRLRTMSHCGVSAGRQPVGHHQAPAPTGDRSASIRSEPRPLMPACRWSATGRIIRSTQRRAESPRIDFPRQALHAEILTLEHPDKPGTRMAWTAALPRDLRQLEAGLHAGRSKKRAL